MAIAKFTQVVSFFKTTLSQRLSDTASDVTLDDVPGGIVEYPTWAVIEPQGANKELIYLPTAPTSLTYSSVVRGLDPESNNDTLAATFNKEHPANVEVIIAPTHRHWNELVKVMDGTVGTGANILRVGDETDVDVTIYAQNADAAKPYVQYDSATNKWLISNDGTSTFDISAGGSGLTRGPGVDVVASAITLDVRASGGIRNNQGTGSVQTDVDPAIVARLDTANTWAAVQSATSDNLQITTDPDTANDAVRKSYADSIVAFGSVSGTSGEAITKGQGVYLKASDGKLWKTVGSADEASYSFVGIALSTVAGADLAVTYAPPGHTVTGLSSLTAGAYYFITDTAGTLGTTPGTRFARVALAISTTALLVTLPKYIVKGTFTVAGTGNTTVTTGFYPAYVTFRVGSTTGTSNEPAWSVGDDSNSCVSSRGAIAAPSFDNGNAGKLYVSTATTVLLAGTVSAKSATGFTWNTATFAYSDGSNYTHNVQWAAFSE